MTGPLLAAVELGWLSASTAGAVWILTVVVGCLAMIAKELLEALKVARHLLSVGDLLAGIVVWELVGLVMTLAVLGWPEPSRGFFEVAAQVNVTLLAVAGLLEVFPPAWSGAQLPFTWILASVIVMVAGLVGAVAGSLNVGGGPVLVAVVVSPIAPAVVAFLMRVYGRLPRSP